MIVVFLCLTARTRLRLRRCRAFPPVWASAWACVLCVRWEGLCSLRESSELRRQRERGVGESESARARARGRDDRQRERASEKGEEESGRTERATRDGLGTPTFISRPLARLCARVPYGLGRRHHSCCTPPDVRGRRAFDRTLPPFPPRQSRAPLCSR